MAATEGYKELPGGDRQAELQSWDLRAEGPDPAARGARRTGRKRGKHDTAFCVQRELMWTIAFVLSVIIMEGILAVTWPPSRWDVVMEDTACQDCPDKPYLLDTIKNLPNLDACKTQCEYTEGCEAVDWNSDKKECAINAGSCDPVSCHGNNKPGVSSHELVTPCELDDGTEGVLDINDECQALPDPELFQVLPTVIFSPHSKMFAAILAGPYMFMFIREIVRCLSPETRKKIFGICSFAVGGTVRREIIVLVILIPVWYLLTTTWYGPLPTTMLQVIQMPPMQMLWMLVSALFAIMALERLVKSLIFALVTGCAKGGSKAVVKIGTKTGGLLFSSHEKTPEGEVKKHGGCHIPGPILWTAILFYLWLIMECFLYLDMPASAWLVISETKACEICLSRRKPYKLSSVEVSDKMSCKAECEYTTGCKAVDWFADRKGKPNCNLYTRPCAVPKADYDGASSYAMKVGCTMEDGTIGVLLEGECEKTPEALDQMETAQKVIFSPKSLWITAIMMIPWAFLHFRFIYGLLSPAMKERVYSMYGSPFLRKVILLLVLIPLWMGITWYFFWPPPSAELTSVFQTELSTTAWYVLSVAFALVLVEEILAAIFGEVIKETISHLFGCLCLSGKQLGQESDTEDEEKLPSNAVAQ